MPEEMSRIFEQRPQQPPNNTEEYFTESFTEVLRGGIGYYVVCEFLIGNNNLVEKRGILYAAGMNFLTLKDPEREQYTVCDIYSLKFATFYQPGHWPQPRTAAPPEQPYTAAPYRGAPNGGGFQNRSGGLY